MIKVQDKQINTDIFTVLQTVKSQCAVYGMTILSDIRKHGNTYLVSCPVHKMGQEKHASCGVDCESGVFHCFTCGVSGNICKFVSLCFGKSDEGEFGRHWLLTNFDTLSIPELITFDPKPKKKVFATEYELQRYRYYHPYMFQRGLTEDIINKFDIGYDSQTDCITFPVRDLYGNLVFIARRSVNTKFYQYPQEAEKPVAYLNYVAYGSSDVWVCESFFNALSCWKRGIPAVALMGTGTPHQAQIMCERKDIRGITLAFDGDEAGDKGSKRFGSMLRKNFLVEKLIVPRGKDLNDLQEEEWKSLEKTLLW